MTDTYTVTPGVSEGIREYPLTPGESGRQDAVQIRKSSGGRTHSVYVPPLAAIALRITGLLSWPKEWDGYQMAPSRESAMRAFRWIKRLYEDVPAISEKWLDPLIVADAHGNVVFEWLNGNNRLVVYVSPETVEYLKAWGPDIWSDMKDGVVETPAERQDLWRWLVGQP